MRGVTYQENQDRWKCSHYQKGKIQQKYFDNEFDAILCKLKYCLADRSTPYQQRAKKAVYAINSDLPIGLSDCSKNGDRHFILVRAVTQYGQQKRELVYGSVRTRELAINLGVAWRNKVLHDGIEQELEAHGMSTYLPRFTEFLSPMAA